MDPSLHKNRKPPKKAAGRFRPIIISCPEGGYVFINHNTPQRFVAVGTTGLLDCCLVMITDIAFENIFFAHIDRLTELNDKQHGLPAWLDCIWLIAQHDMSKMHVFVGDQPAGHYYNTVNRIVTKFSTNHRTQRRGNSNTIQITTVDPNAPSICVKHRIPRLFFGKEAAGLANFQESGIGVSLGSNGMRLIHRFTSHLISTSQRGVTHPPFCYFNENAFASTHTIRQQCPIPLQHYFDQTPPTSPEPETQRAILEGLSQCTLEQQTRLPISITNMPPASDLQEADNFGDSFDEPDSDWSEEAGKNAGSGEWSDDFEKSGSGDEGPPPIEKTLSSRNG